MNVKLYGLLAYRNNYCLPTIYGYSTKGLPGIDIVGLGSMGRVLKEKIIFITREFNQKYPLKRYVLSVEGVDHLDKNDIKELKNLELGFLILFWKLAEIISISRLEQCLCSGQINVRQELTSPPIKNDFWHELDKELANKKSKVTVIGPTVDQRYEFIQQFPIQSLLQQLTAPQ